MKGAVLYFSGTGNTEFAAKQFKNQFAGHGVECGLFDISKKRSIIDDYDFFIFGCPIYAGSFTEYYMDWISKNINNGNSRKCIVFSTSAGSMGIGIFELSGLLVSRGFDVFAKANITMPNSYSLSSADMPDEDETIKLKANAVKKIEEIVDGFISGRRTEIDISEEKLTRGREVYKKFSETSNSWAINNLKADMDICVKCSKCVKNCPTHNISLGESLKYKDKCIACQRCIHGCPVNAIKIKR